jgi:hypothetical protein
MLFLEQVKLEAAYLLPSHVFRRLTEIFRGLLNREDVAADRFRRIVAALEFLQHPSR